ncbi:phospholipase D family protein [Alkalibacterium iburiense]|uniref:Phospholipase D family protein n=1 Tax=Alkalibacterium iburiense TaxID=290589 RepID=A0ABN0XKU5_9LACT
MDKASIIKGLKIIGLVIGIYIVYVFITAGIIPVLGTPPERIEDRPLEFIETSERVTLLEYGLESNGARVNSIEEAEETIDVAFYYMDEGSSVDQFYAYILDAANRGVKVRYLLDGVSHGIRGQYRDVFHLFNQHPNIEFKLYEPIGNFVLEPWRINNRLHDKMLIIDNKYAIIGGRNIGDIYFQRNHSTEPYSFDRDILISNVEDQEDGIISQMKAYHNELWESEFAENQGRIMFPWETRIADTIQVELEELHSNYQEEITKRPHASTIEDWVNRSVEIERGLLSHNGLERGFKQPQVWSDLLTLAEEAEDELFIQTPWLVPDRRMRRDMEQADLSFKTGTLLTNGESTTANIIGQSGTENRKQEFIESPLDYYEFQPQNSALHMKTWVADRRISAVGAFNFDARSAYLSTESMVFIESEALAEQILTESEESYIAKSVLFEEDGAETLGENTNGEDPSFWRDLAISFLRPLARIFESLI